jgi:hypothetical protein
MFPHTPRRQFLQKFGLGLGSLASAELFYRSQQAQAGNGILQHLHHAPKAKRVIFMFMSGAPSQLDLFDYKPLLNERHGTELPPEIRGGQRLTGMSGNQSSLPLVGSPFKFEQHGQSGSWVSDLLPHTAKIADELCFIKSMHTESINHGPGVTHIQTGSQIPGRPSIGAWLSYGLGTDNDNLPAYVVMITKDKKGQPLGAPLWGSGFLPSQHQAVQFRSGKDPILYLHNPQGLPPEARREMLDSLLALHQVKNAEQPSAMIESRIAQQELSYRMQMSIPEALDLAQEPKSVLDMYGPDVTNPGSFAANCLLARRLTERGVRFVQLFHQDWDHHGGLPGGIKNECKQTDQPAAALVMDLKQRGLLEDTLVIWGGEFGRTNYCQGKFAANNFGRDHHPRCFTIWMAGGGVKPGFTYGATDPFGYNITENPVHIHDLQATILHLLGINHEKLTYKYQGRDFRLTDVAGNVVQDILI